MKERYLSLLLILLILLTGTFLLKQWNLFSLFENIVVFLSICVTSLCFVFVFEPLIERIPVRYRVIQCSIVYVALAVILIATMMLLVPVISSQWDSISALFHQVRSLGHEDTEMTLQVEKAVSSVLPFLLRLKNGLLSYVLAFFISIEFPDLKQSVSQVQKVQKTLQYYDEFKELIFQYIKAISIDIGLLFIGQCAVLGFFQVRYFVALALFLSFMNIIPYFGSTLAQIFIFLVDYLTYGRFRFGMILCVFLFQQIESNCLQPVLYGKMMNLKPLYMMISILFFGSLFGFLGVLFAPVFAVLIQFLIKVKKNS